MSKIRILIVDDSALGRKMLTRLLESEPDITVAGTASDGRAAISQTQELQPDLVVLDIEMPIMNGLDAVTELRKLSPQLPVLMFSALTEKGGATTMEALDRGASDYVTKPGSLHSNWSAATLRENLGRKIRALTLEYKNKQLRAGKKPTYHPPLSVHRPSKPPKVIVVGSSTGGPKALASLLSKVSPHVSVPMVIVQHMPPVFTRVLAERLSAQSGRLVQEGYEGALLEPGTVWVAPGGHHTQAKRLGHQVRLRLDELPPINSCRPSVDPLFRSVAKIFGAETLAIVLTGMGQDGFKGASAIREQGGALLVQDEDSSVVWGMPGTIAKAGLAQAELSPLQLADEINIRACSTESAWEERN